MIRFLLNVGVSLVSSAVALLVCAWLIDGFDLRAQGFVIAVAIFTAVQAVMGPFVFNMARKYASAVLGGIGLVSTLLSLLITSIVGSSLSISGAAAWISSTVLIWLITALGTWGIGFLVVTKWREARSSAKAKDQAIEDALDRRAKK
ncbi:phage holin family protein [Gordonia sp. PDNC005]|uniref:phage holin family protein n=1 Tax=unclassified Gordonia (in: high G+C Gram-positive bacteria) TaxID=2657482 RepID=UPI0019655BEE|nr:phage holin family protein [Gordonia sp. PDNC005]QRY61028.1 phage holin family protein [Gordonia sp. PDNC005]